MKLITSTALALVAALAATPAVAQTKPAPAQQQQEPKATPSKGALKALSELNDAVQKNDVANIPAKLAAAQAVATTKDDKYLIGRLQLQAAIAAKNNAAMAAAVDAIAASNFLDAAAVSKFYSGLGGSLYNEKEYARAAAAYQRALALNPNNSDAANMLGDALLAGGQKAEAVAAYQRLLQSDAAAGRKPDEALIKRALAVAYDAKSPVAIDLARQWVTSYPSPASWSDTVAIYTNLNQPDVEGRLDLYRLMQATGALKTGGEYAQYARLAADQNNFNEAQAAFDAGVAAKLIDPAKPDYRDLVQGLKTKGKASAADLEAAAKSAQSGIALVHIGDRYAAMGNNAKAVELYRAALSKPGTDAGVANLHLGIALARSGDKAGATAALNAVTGARADIAKLWLTYVNQKA
jgi:tetratricopeptide (TPR) repeat protein